MSDEPFGIRGVQQTDYFQIQCRTCNGPTKNKFLGTDPVMPYFRATCDNKGCVNYGDSRALKMNVHLWTGWPSEPEEIGSDDD